jgi:hypothetical protein
VNTDLLIVMGAIMVVALVGLGYSLFSSHPRGSKRER